MIPNKTKSSNEDKLNMKLTEMSIDKLNDINYLVLSYPKQFVFNDYKTDKTYGKQVFEVPEDLDRVINQSNTMLSINLCTFGMPRDA